MGSGVGQTGLSKSVEVLGTRGRSGPRRTNSPRREPGAREADPSLRKDALGDAGPGETDIAVVTLGIPITSGYGCLYQLSVAYPLVKIEVMYYLISGREALSRCRFTGPLDLEEIVTFLQDSPDVRHVEVVSKPATPTQVQIQWETPRSSVAKIANELHILPNFPLEIQDGVLTLVVVAPAERIRQLYRNLLRIGYLRTRILSMRHKRGIGPESLLTERQNEMFRSAMRAGYWDVPRRITMAQLAKDMGISKSAVAEMLATIEMKVLHEASQLVHGENAAAGSEIHFG